MHARYGPRGETGRRSPPFLSAVWEIQRATAVAAVTSFNISAIR